MQGDRQEYAEGIHEERKEFVEDNYYYVCCSCCSCDRYCYYDDYYDDDAYDYAYDYSSDSSYYDNYGYFCDSLLWVLVLFERRDYESQRQLQSKPLENDYHRAVQQTQNYWVYYVPDDEE